MILARLVAARRSEISEGSSALTVDVDYVAAALEVAPRSARRICHQLVEQGMAWPMPALRSNRAGRPRQQFKLLADKLD